MWKELVCRSKLKGSFMKPRLKLAEVLPPNLETAFGALDPGVGEAPIGTEFEGEIEVELLDASGGEDRETTNIDPGIDGRVELVEFVVAVAGRTVKLQSAADPELDLPVEQIVSSHSPEAADKIPPFGFHRFRFDLVEIERRVIGKGHVTRVGHDLPLLGLSLVLHRRGGRRL